MQAIPAVPVCQKSFVLGLSDVWGLRQSGLAVGPHFEKCQNAVSHDKKMAEEPEDAANLPALEGRKKGDKTE